MSVRPVWTTVWDMAYEGKKDTTYSTRYLGRAPFRALLILTLNSSVQKEMKLIPNFNDEYNQ